MCLCNINSVPFLCFMQTLKGSVTLLMLSTTIFCWILPSPYDNESLNFAVASYMRVTHDCSLMCSYVLEQWSFIFCGLADWNISWRAFTPGLFVIKYFTISATPSLDSLQRMACFWQGLLLPWLNLESSATASASETDISGYQDQRFLCAPFLDVVVWWGIF